MNIINELEAMRARMIDEINTEFSLLIDRVIDEGIAVSGINEEPIRDSCHYLSVGTRIFKGTKPINVIFSDGRTMYVPNWKQVVKVIMDNCLENKRCEKLLMDMRGKVSGKTRVLINKTDEDMKSPLQLKEDLYIETHYDTETLLNVLTKRILDEIDFDYSAIKITVRKNHNRR